MGLLTSAQTHQALLKEAAALERTHLRELLQADDRPLQAHFNGVVLDFSRQKVTSSTLQLLEALYEEQGVAASMAAAQAGAMQNPTEERSVLHTALRASRAQRIEDKDGHDVVPDVYAVLDRIKKFSEEIRNGQRRGATGKLLTNVVVIGIGGSYLVSKVSAPRPRRCLRVSLPRSASSDRRVLWLKQSGANAGARICLRGAALPRAIRKAIRRRGSYIEIPGERRSDGCLPRHRRRECTVCVGVRARARERERD